MADLDELRASSVKSGPARAPILRALAIPPHMMWVPLDLWKVAIGCAIAGAIVPGLLEGTGEVRPEIFVIVLGVLWPTFANQYRRDPHIVKVWKARLWGRPIAPTRGTINVAAPARRSGRIRLVP